MMKDYTVLDGMITNQSAVLKAAYDRGYAHGLADGIERTTSEMKKADRKNYDKGYMEGYKAGVQVSMENKAITTPKNKLRMLFHT